MDSTLAHPAPEAMARHTNHPRYTRSESAAQVPANSVRESLGILAHRVRITGIADGVVPLAVQAAGNVASLLFLGRHYPPREGRVKHTPRKPRMKRPPPCTQNVTGSLRRCVGGRGGGDSTEPTTDLLRRVLVFHLLVLRTERLELPRGHSQCPRRIE